MSLSLDSHPFEDFTSIYHHTIFEESIFGDLLILLFLTKILLFAKPERKYYRDPWGKISGLLGVSSDQAKRATQSRTEFAELIRKRFNSPL